MAGFLYAVESVQPLDAVRLGCLGFPFVDQAGLPGRSANTPTGEWQVFALDDPSDPAGRAPRVGYYPEEQNWVQPAGGKYRIGWFKDEPPGPADLRLKALVPGYDLTLRDGRQWTVPVVRQYEGGTGLPHVWGLDAAGEVAGRVDPRYARLYELAWRIWETMVPEASPMTYEELLEAVALAMRVNYRLGREELLALELFGDAELGEAVGLIVDRPTWEKLLADQKKKAGEPGVS